MPRSQNSLRLRLTLASLVFAAVPATAQTGARECHLRNPILAVVPEIWVAGVGHLYVGGGEQKRGALLLGTTLAGAALVIGPALAPSETATGDDIVNVGVGAMVASYLFSIGDIVPALVRERRRCERGDVRSQFTIRPFVEPRRVGADGRRSASLSVGVSLR